MDNANGAGPAQAQTGQAGQPEAGQRTTNPAEQTAGTRLPESTEKPKVAPTASAEEAKEVAAKPLTAEGTQEAPKPTEEAKPAETKTDRTNLEQVRDLVSDAGLDVGDVAQVLKDNEGKLSPEVMLALKEKYGDAVTGLIADQLGTMYASQVEAGKAKDKAVHDQVAEAFQGITEQSGEETWKELAGWAKENVPNEDRKEINALLAQGGMAAKLAVKELCDVFKQSTATAQTQDAQLMEADGVTSGDDRGLIDKVTYTEQLNALLAKGHDYNTSIEIKKLDARRMKSMKNGY